MASGGRRPRPPADVHAIVAEIVGPRARPDLDWLRVVAPADASALRRVVGEFPTLLPLERAIHEALRATGRTYYAQFPAPLELYALTRLVRPRHVLESGVSSGLSTAHILAALVRNGRGQLHSMDLPRHQKGPRRRRGELSWSLPPGRDCGWAIPQALKGRWDLRQGRSEDLLPDLLMGVPAVDLYCHDSPWTPQHLAFEFDAIRPKLHRGSVVVADNADHNPAAAEALARAVGGRVAHRRRSTLIGIRVP